MLPLKSKTVVLAISPDGLALRLPNRRAILISKQPEQNNVALNHDVLANALATHTDDLKNKMVRVVLANHFMRYLVLPWETGVTSRSDWLALAEQAFRKHHGTAASGWDLRVSLSQHGAPVIASAMDKQLIESLEALALSMQFKLAAIEPLLMAIAPKHHSQDSFMIIEPGRLLFCEMEGANISQFTAISPPAQQEANSAKQLMTRYFLQNHAQETGVVSYVSAPLNADWAQAVADGKKERVVYLNKQASSHACWLAEL